MSAKKVTCPKCRKAFGILERQLGTEVYCPHCGQKMRLPAPAPASGAAPVESLQQAAAAQLFGDAAPTPSAGRPSSSTPKVQMAQGVPPAGSDTALARHLGLDQQSHEPSALATAPVRSKAVAWVWTAIVVLGLGGLVAGILWRQSDLSRQRAAVAAEDARREEQRKAAAAKRVDEDRQRRILRGEKVTDTPELTPLESAQADPRNVEMDEVLPDPLVFHTLMKNGMPHVAYRETPAQRETLFGYCENTRETAVRRVTMSIWAGGADTNKVYGQEDITFCDVQPGEKVYFAFEYPFVNEKGTKWGKKMLELQTEQPEFEFEVTVGRIQRDGAKSGVISCTVTNNTAAKARKVQLLAILFDAMNEASGVARGDVYDLGPGRSQEVKLRWENWDSEFIQRAEVRAQIAPEE